VQPCTQPGAKADARIAGSSTAVRSRQRFCDSLCRSLERGSASHRCCVFLRYRPLPSLAPVWPASPLAAAGALFGDDDAVTSSNNTGGGNSSSGSGVQWPPTKPRRVETNTTAPSNGSSGGFSFASKDNLQSYSADATLPQRPVTGQLQRQVQQPLGCSQKVMRPAAATPTNIWKQGQQRWAAAAAAAL